MRTSLVLFVALTTCFVGAGVAEAASVLPASASVVAMAAPQTAVASVTPVAAAVPTLAIRNCGLFKTCIYLNPVDQRAVITGGGLAVTLALCAIPVVGNILCNVIRVAMAVIVVYLAANPPCTRELKMQVSPITGRPVCT
jgi:hypothetical protein